MTPELFATAAAYDLVAKGMPFREAYKQIGNNLESLQAYNVDEALHKSKHLGGTGNLGLDKIEQSIQNIQKVSEEQKQNYQSMKEAILSFHY